MGGIDSTIVETLLAAQSMSASFTSPPVEISRQKGYSVEADWSGATGASADTFLIQGSVSGINYVTVATFPIITTSGSVLLNVETPRYEFFRVVFSQVNASAGTMNVYVSAKS